MKISKLPLLLFCLFFSFQASAQFELGITNGITFSNVSIKGINEVVLPDNKTFSAYTFGLAAAYNLDEKFSIISGLNYEKRGFDASYSADLPLFGTEIPIGATLKTRVNYVEVPLGLKFAFPTGSGKIKPFIAAGANLGYAVSGDTRLVANFIINFNVAREDINMKSDNVQRLDVSPFVVGGIEAPYKNGVFSFQFGFEHSVVNFLKDSALDIRFKHYAFTPSIGYRYIFRKKENYRA